MGVVYLAHDERLDMEVALKLVGTPHGDATLWLKREFRAVASLRHRNLVELYELGSMGSSCFFTMEYLPGHDPRRWTEANDMRSGEIRGYDSAQSTRTVPPLQEARTEVPADFIEGSDAIIARAAPPVDFERVRSVLAQLAEGLTFLHGRGVIHRDVKPSNVLIASSVVKLLDFGLALEERRRDGELAPEGRIVGTAAYLAPEYLESLAVTPALDVYALGVLGYELVTGAPPFGGAIHMLSRQHKRGPAPGACTLNPDLPPELGALIDRMIIADPALRPSALEVVQELTGDRSQPSQQRRALGFIGRKAQLETLATALGDQRSHGRFVLVTGPSGVGKTALVDEALGRATIDGRMLAWRGRCHERERVPYRAFDQIIDDLSMELSADPRPLVHAGALARVFPVLAPSLALDDEPAAGDLRVERERAVLALIELMRSLVKSARAAILIDDLQWADDESLELLKMMVERIERPLTVIAAWTTDGELPPELLDKLPPTTIVPLEAMGEVELADMIAELAPRAARLRVLAAARLAAGSPYLAELIGAELATADVAEVADAEHRRLSRLAGDERAVAEVAATGGTASFDELRAVVGLPAGRVRSALRGLEDARVVRAMPSAAGDAVYAFYHQRLRAAAQAGMAEDVRRERHQRFARYYEGAGGSPAQVAIHWRDAGEPGRAAPWAVAAGDSARAQLAWSVAADWYSMALDLITSADTPGRTDDILLPDAGAVRLARADARFLGGKLAGAAEDYLLLAHATADGDRHRVRAAEAYLKLGEIERGLRVLDDVLGRRGEKRARGRVQSLGRAIAVATTWLVPLGRRAEPIDDVRAAAYRAIASFLSTPHPLEALEYVLRGVALAERSADRAAQSQGMSMLAAYLAAGTLGRFGDRALVHAEQLATQCGAPYAEMVAAGCTGILAMLRGDWVAMRSAHGKAETICNRLGLGRTWEASFLRSYWALGELYAGEPTTTLAILADDTSDDLFGRAMIGSYRGRAMLYAGDLAGARAAWREQERSSAFDRGMAGIYRRVFGCELALAAHDWNRARAAADDLANSARTQWLSAMPAVRAIVDVPSASADLGLARHGDRDAAARVLRTAKRLHRLGGASFYGPTALRMQGQAEAFLGQDRAAAKTLERAESAARATGGAIDRLAITALRGGVINPGVLGAALTWNTGGEVRWPHA